MAIDHKATRIETAILRACLRKTASRERGR